MTSNRAEIAERFGAWLDALQSRHLADLHLREVTPALRALSSTYVERRERIVRGGALDTAGKRAAFALFYGPLHFLTAWRVVEALEASRTPAAILDVGCGTGAAGAAWALLQGGPETRVTGIDRHPWTVAEARWTYRMLHLNGRAHTGDLSRLPRGGQHDAIVAAYVLNELDEHLRRRVLDWMLGSSAQILVLEPLSRAVTPWWDEAAALFDRAGGRSDDWKFAVERPALLATLDQAAGLDHRIIGCRTLSLNVSHGAPP